MPFWKKLRNTLVAGSNNEDNNSTHVIPVSSPSPGRTILSLGSNMRPQALQGRSRRCHYCRNIVILPYEMRDGYKVYQPYKHQPSYRHLLASAQQGCDICMLFRDRLISLPDSKDWDAASVLLYTDEQLEWISGSVSSNEYPDTTHLTIKLVTGLAQGKQTCVAAVKFGLFERQVPPSNTCVIGRPIDPDPRSASCLRLLSLWLHECAENHTRCQGTRTGFFPTRIIDVGPADGSQEPRLRLAASGNLRGSYVALSHCWGETQSLTTLLKNLEHRLESIPLSTVPANFRDAVWVTRRLGVRYLWIDSLCIIQDSRADWELEAESMGEIYGNSFLTIAAANAKNSSEGFLQPRPASVTRTLATFSAVSGDGEQLLNLGLREHPDSWKIGVDQSVLNGRGWTLQERVMPCRVLHFGKQMMYWECHQTMKSEGGLNPNDCVSTNPFIFSKAKLHDFWNDEQQGSFSDELQRWYACLDEFSGRKLKYHSDKFSAIAGVAKSMRTRTPQLDVYYAGIWKSDFVRGLLWRAARLGGMSPPSSFRAPTWSWAALEGKIKHDWSELRYFDPNWWPEIRGITIRCKGRSSYGEIESGCLRLKAPGRPAVYVGTPPRAPPAIVGPMGLVIQAADDPVNQWYDLWHFGPDSWQPIGPPLCRAYFDQPIEERKLKPYVLMCMGKFSSCMKPQNWWEEADWNCEYWALILTEVDPDSSDGILRRVGVACMNEKYPFKGWGALEKNII